VAIPTGRLRDVHSLGDFLYLPEVLLVALFFWLMVEGAGRISADYCLRRFAERHTPAAPELQQKRAS
jgi:hypothetical protein